MVALTSSPAAPGTSRNRVLVIGSTAPDSAPVREALVNCRLEKADVACVISPEDAGRHVHDDVAAILLDLQSEDALEVVARIREQWPRVRVILFHSGNDRLLCMEVLAAAREPGAPPTVNLSGRQLEILRHLASGLSVKEIAQAMRMSYKSVDSLKYRLMRRLAIRDRVGLTRFAIREGLVAP